MSWYNENANNDFIDATQETTALTNDTVINIPNENDEDDGEPNTGLDTTINDLINLKLDANGNFQVYINNHNDDGEIRFYIKNAKNINDFNFNIFTQSYSNPRLTYNTKIDKDGRINYYHSYSIFNPVKLSGWYVINDDISALEITQNLIGIGLGTVQGQVLSLSTDYFTFKSVTTINVANLYNLLHNLYATSGRGGLASWKTNPETQKTFAELFKDLGGVVDTTTNLGGSMALPALVGLSGSRTVFFQQFINNLGNALTFSGIATALYAIYSYLDEQQKSNILENIETLERLKMDTKKNIENGDTSSLQPNNIYIDFLIIDQTTNNGFTTAGVYTSINIQKGASLGIRIKDNGSGVLVAEIIQIMKTGSGFNVGENIFINKSNIGGSSGQLKIVVSALKSYQFILEQDGVKATTELKEVDNSQRRRLNIPNIDDFDDVFNIVETPYTNPITGEVLKSIQIKLDQYDTKL